MYIYSIDILHDSELTLCEIYKNKKSQSALRYLRLTETLDQPCDQVLQCVAVCCSVLQCVEVCLFWQRADTTNINAW